KNGVIHVIDKVLTPPPPAAVCGDGNMDAGEACDDGNTDDGDGCSAMCTVEMTGPGKLPAVLMDEGFASFLGAIMGTKAETEISGDEEYTVFAPNDAAFTAFGSLTGVDAAVVENILLNHVADGAVMKDGLAAASPITSLANLPLMASATAVGGQML